MPNRKKGSGPFTEDEQELDERLSRLVEQQYGIDGLQARSAAIVIQRAFRKHQICKRFRTITEQLRQSGPARHRAHPSASNQTALAAPGLPEPPINCSRPLTSGTTRAAAWSTLNQALYRQHVQEQGTIVACKQQVSGRPDPVVAAALDFQQLESIRKRQYRVGLNVFNKNPEKGISFLIAHSFIDASSPFIKNSSTISYYQSNQMHFIENQQQNNHSLNHDQPLLDATTKANNLLIGNLSQPTFSCNLCFEEDNLKRNVAYFLLHRKGLAKEKIGQYLGNLQNRFNQDVLKYYLKGLDFHGMQIDLALRKFLSTFRLPGEAQKIERIVDCFAYRYSQCQLQQPLQLSSFNNQQLTSDPNQVIISNAQSGYQGNQTRLNSNQNASPRNNLILLTKDEIFILTFAIIMLNTDLHSPSLKPTSRMSASQFVNNLRGIFKSQIIQECDLIEIYERVKANQISTSPDHVNHVLKVQQGLTVNNFQRKELPVSINNLSRIQLESSY